MKLWFTLIFFALSINSCDGTNQGRTISGLTASDDFLAEAIDDLELYLKKRTAEGSGDVLGLESITSDILFTENELFEFIKTVEKNIPYEELDAVPINRLAFLSTAYIKALMTTWRKSLLNDEIISLIGDYLQSVDRNIPAYKQKFFAENIDTTHSLLSAQLVIQVFSNLPILNIKLEALTEEDRMSLVAALSNMLAESCHQNSWNKEDADLLLKALKEEKWENLPEEGKKEAVAVIIAASDLYNADQATCFP